MVAAVKVQPAVETVKVEDPREDRMLRLAVEKNTQLQALGNGTYAAHSDSTPDGIRYLTTNHSCTCEWFSRTHTTCSHIALVRFEESLDGPEPSAPAATPAQWTEIVYGIEQHVDGTARVIEFFIRQHGDVRRSDVGTYQTVEEARTAIARAKARRERGPVHAVDCPVCDGWSCDQHGIACQHCGGTGYMIQPAPTVADLIATGRWPGQVAEQAA